MRRPIFWCLKTATLLMLAVTTAGPARADLVLNGNFGTGDYTSWSLAGDSSGFDIASGQLTGSTYQAALTTNSDDEAYLTQSLSTTAGQQYVFSFLLAGDGATPNSFSASLGGITLVDLTDIGNTLGAGTSYSVDYTATSATTLLSFAVDDAPGYLYLTNVSVTLNTSAVPEPASILGVAIGLAMLMGYVCMNRRRSLAVLPLRS